MVIVLYEEFNSFFSVSVVFGVVPGDFSFVAAGDFDGVFIGVFCISGVVDRSGVVLPESSSRSASSVAGFFAAARSSG